MAGSMVLFLVALRYLSSGTITASTRKVLATPGAYLFVRFPLQVGGACNANLGTARQSGQRGKEAREGWYASLRPLITAGVLSLVGV